ncbi:MAG: hypothetical protein ACFE9S_02750 [Candidatus Hermodarchaeota archaeon]
MNNLFCSSGKFFKGPLEKKWMSNFSNGEVTLTENYLLLDNSPKYLIGTKTTTSIKYEIPVQNIENAYTTRHQLVHILHLDMKDGSKYSIGFQTQFDKGNKKINELIELLKQLIPGLSFYKPK